MTVMAVQVLVPLLLALLTSCACAAPASSHGAPTNLDVTMSSYLGGGTEETVSEALTVGIDSKGHVIIGGSGTYNYGLTPTVLAEGGNGFVLVLSNGGKTLSRLYRFGDEVSRLVVREKDDVTRILVQSDKGLALFNGDLDHVLWNKPMFCPRGRCYSDLGSDGTVAVVIAGESVGDPYTVQTFAADGSSIGSGSDPEQIGDVLNDIAVDPVNRQVIIASYFDRDPRKIPCVFAFDYGIENQRWHDFCVTADEEEAAQKTAAVWIHRIHFSDFDNKLYVAANSHGGNMILLLNPDDIHKNNDSLIGISDDQSVIQHYDYYTQTWGFHGHHIITYVARYNPADGGLEAASFIVPRFSDEAPCLHRGSCVNDCVSVDISSGPDGTILVAQNASKYIQNRANLTVNGAPLAGYQGPQEAVLLGVPPALDRRQIWHHFAKTPGASEAVAVAAGNYLDKTHVVFIAASSENEFVTVNSLPGTGRASSSVKQYAIIVLEMPESENPSIVG